MRRPASPLPLLPTRPSQPKLLSRLSAYPNPTTGELTLTTADERPLTGRWVLHDLLGREVQTGTLLGGAPCRLALGGQPAGLYLLRVTDQRLATTQTLRIEIQ
jgi:hypothetical protein